MKVSTVSSRQPSTIPVIEIGPAGERVGTVEGAQPALAGPERLPAGRRGQRLTLCKETADLLFTGKLSKNSSVPQYTPGGKRHRGRSEDSGCLKGLTGSEGSTQPQLKSQGGRGGGEWR